MKTFVVTVSFLTLFLSVLTIDETDDDERIVTAEVERNDPFLILTAVVLGLTAAGAGMGAATVGMTAAEAAKEKDKKYGMNILFMMNSILPRWA